MAYYLPDNHPEGERAADTAVREPSAGDDMADLKIFWGPEICRLEYLLHLLDTGRIIDERTAPSV